MSEPGDDTPKADVPSHGVVVRAQNGDVIRYDPTGLVLRLSDAVIEDIALRMAPPAATPAAASTPERSDTPKPAADTPADELLDGIDAWGVQQDGDWLRFTARLPGAQGTRGFRRHITGGAVLGDGPGPLLGILGFGGPSAALATAGAPVFPQHVVAPEDDIGAVGMAGIEPAPATDRLEHLREVTHEALVAETLLHWRLDAYAPLPLIMARAETDNAAQAGDLAGGQAVGNLVQAARNLKDAAAAMGKRAKLLGVCLDYALEDTQSDATAYRDGMLAAMDRISAALWDLGFDQPLFVSRFAGGLPDLPAAAIIEGQWDLSWNHGDHSLIYSAPSYAFARDAYDRPTDDARRQMAEMTAAALSAGKDWRAPTLFLAETEAADPSVIRVTAQADGDLVLDTDDPFGAGASAGFTLQNVDNGATIAQVTVAEDDPKALRITCDRPPTGPDLRLAYAAQGPGALRDDWNMTSRTGAVLRRWAIPARLPVHAGPAS